jgi:DNA-binding ferritin-like protein
MTKFNKRIMKTKTRKNMNSKASPGSSALLQNFEREITIQFLEMSNTIKLYHWKTYSYATHKATDELYQRLGEHTDKFIEVLLGKAQNRTNLMNVKTIRLRDMQSHEDFKRVIEEYKNYLVGLNNHKAMNLMSNTDLFNIRDEILGDLNQFLYLYTFK